ncbi:MAG: hypothetical protein HY674_08425 [Chloroflexi bacterium]|nr:hypothetical protein [Chloroflexota bacterium]
MSTENKLQIQETPFVNEVRLGAAQWAIALGIVGLAVGLTPLVWQKLERFEIGPDYRQPYPLSKDYWLYQRRLRQLDEPRSILVLGDSVIWGEYVRPDGTLPHFLTHESGAAATFVNAGVNGLFPLAMEGLERYYGGAIHGRKVLLHCNVLWLTSPKADLQTDKEEKFNHAGLVPQFRPRIPCYKAEIADRLEIVAERHLNFMAWVRHLQNAYFDQKNILAWTLAEDGGDPPKYPNAYKNPLAQITMAVPEAPKEDPERGPASPRHKPWSSDGKGRTQFEWVDLETSLQWGAFQRLTKLLRERGNDVLVLIGPFNEHIMTEDNRAAFRRLRDGMAAWLVQNQVPSVTPAALPSELYADASHPLTDGYALLAKQLSQNESFRKWLGPK